MSLIKLQGNASGTGAFTIAAPNGNTDRTLTLPDATGTVVTADGSGNVGIGTTSPATRLHLSDAGSVFIQITDQGDGASRIGQNGTALTFGVDASNGSTERARITSAGDVGIGTTSPAAKLHVVGGIRYDASVTVGNGLNVVAAYSLNNGSGNAIGSVNGGFTVIAISQGNGMTIVPVFANAGGGIAWNMSMFDPDAANFVYGAGPTVSFATAGTAANSYTIAVAGGTGVATITRTAGSAAYTVHVLSLVS